MPVNKLALLRYRTIDKCLQNRFRKWTLDDLIDAVSDALYEYEGIDSGVSRRTIQLDIQNMRSDKLGFDAPIVVKGRKFYTYEDSNYSITDTPISEEEVTKLSEVVAMLRQFKGFGYFKDLTAMVTRLEDKISRQKNEGVSYIHLDTNEQLKGLEFIESIHRAILKKNTLSVFYQSFKAERPIERTIFPYLLKEYNNRWFLLCKFGNNPHVALMALDRIQSLREEKTVEFQAPKINVFNYFDDVIGVSKTARQRGRKIKLRVKKSQIPYLTTKPMHPSQKIVQEAEDWVVLELTVIWNYELEREIIGHGEMMEVLSPARLRKKIKRRLEEMLNIYSDKNCPPQ